MTLPKEGGYGCEYRLDTSEVIGFYSDDWPFGARVTTYRRKVSRAEYDRVVKTLKKSGMDDRACSRRLYNHFRPKELAPDAKRSLAAAIQRNSNRWLRYRSDTRLLRQIRLRVFDYEDAGKLEKAQRIINRLKKRLGHAG